LVTTSAQSGVLYVSGLPVEKNLFKGLRRKLKTIVQAFETIERHEEQRREAGTELSLRPLGSLSGALFPPEFFARIQASVSTGILLIRRHEHKTPQCRRNPTHDIAA
jgi:hypothetical protein